jgi:uncharacterized protein YndB with AHSA1/START domain
MTTTKITVEPGVPFIDMTREFDAPRDLIFRAHTDPDLAGAMAGATGRDDGDRPTRGSQRRDMALPPS